MNENSVVDSGSNLYTSREQSQRTFPFINASGEEIPGHAMLAFAPPGSFERDAMGRKIAHKPGPYHEAVQSPALHAFNMSRAVPPNGSGVCTTDFPAFALHDGRTDSLGAGSPCGPKADSWYVWSSGTAFLADGHDRTFAVRQGASSGFKNIHTIWISSPNPYRPPSLAFISQDASNGMHTLAASAESVFKSCDFIGDSSASFPYNVVKGTQTVDGKPVNNGALLLYRYGWYSGIVSATLTHPTQNVTNGLYVTLEEPPSPDRSLGFIGWRRQQNEVDDYGNIIAMGHENISFPFMFSINGGGFYGVKSDAWKAALRVRSIFSGTGMYSMHLMINYHGGEIAKETE